MFCTFIYTRPVTTPMGKTICSRVKHLSMLLTTLINLVFHPCGVVKLSTRLSGLS